jgi:hypothetical protein
LRYVRHLSPRDLPTLFFCGRGEGVVRFRTVPSVAHYRVIPSEEASGVLRRRRATRNEAIHISIYKKELSAKNVFTRAHYQPCTGKSHYYSSHCHQPLRPLCVTNPPSVVSGASLLVRRTYLNARYCIRCNLFKPRRPSYTKDGLIGGKSPGKPVLTLHPVRGFLVVLSWIGRARWLGCLQAGLCGQILYQWGLTTSEGLIHGFRRSPNFSINSAFRLIESAHPCFIQAQLSLHAHQHLLRLCPF